MHIIAKEKAFAERHSVISDAQAVFFMIAQNTAVYEYRVHVRQPKDRRLFVTPVEEKQEKPVNIISTTTWQKRQKQRQKRYDQSPEKEFG
jgi:hypothetical protein